MNSFVSPVSTGNYPLPVDPALDKFIMEKREQPRQSARRGRSPADLVRGSEDRGSSFRRGVERRLSFAKSLAVKVNARDLSTSLDMKKQKAYARAGVDVDLGNSTQSAASNHSLGKRMAPRFWVKSAVSAACFAPNFAGMREPVLVASVDGVGTKLKIAFAMNKHDTVGADLVNHCVNDIAVLGARPLFFLDYIGAEKLEPPRFP